MGIEQKLLLKTVRRECGNAWIVLSMPNDQTIQISGEWHAHWVDTQLTYDAIKSEPWEDLLAADIKVIHRARASNILNDWVKWMKERHSKEGPETVR